MCINNNNYDRLKWLVLIFLPALAGFIGGLGHLYQWSNFDLYVSTVNLFTAFLGALMQISSKQYHNGGEGNGNSSTGN